MTAIGTRRRKNTLGRRGGGSREASSSQPLDSGQGGQAQGLGLHGQASESYSGKASPKEALRSPQGP